MDRRRVAALIVSLTLLFAFGAPADAHTKVFPTTINHTGTTAPPLTFSGFISTSKDPCVANRTIKLKHGGEIVGSTKTNTKGGFDVESSTSENGDYSISVLRKVFSHTARHKHICGGDSITVTF